MTILTGWSGEASLRKGHLSREQKAAKEAVMVKG